MEIIGMGILLAIGWFLAPYVIILSVAVVSGIVMVITAPFRR